jgi:hypothetical protein
MGKGITDEQAEELIADWRSRGLEIEVRGHAIAGPNRSLAGAGKNIEEMPKNSPKQAIRAPVSPTLNSPGYALWIPEWRPTLVNELRATPYRHWSAPYKKLKRDKKVIEEAFVRSGQPKAWGPRRVSLLFVMPKKARMFDRDAPRKSINDALVACGALINDSPAYCYEGPVHYARALLDCTWGTLIQLVEI